MKEGLYRQAVRSLAGKSAWTGGAVALRALGAVSVFKLVAVFFGAQGVALFSHFQNLLAIFTQIPDQGSSLGIVRLFNEGPDANRRSRLVFTALILNLAVYVIVLTTVIAGSSFFLRHFNEEGLSGIWTISFAISIFFILINVLCLAVLYARQSFKELFFLTGINIFVLIAAVFAGVHTGSLEMAMIAFAIGHGLSGVANVVILLFLGAIPISDLRFDKELMKKLLQFILMAAGGYLFGKVTDFFVRDFALYWFGWEETGLWQAQVRLSDSYRSVFMGTIGMVFYSTISGMVDDKVGLKDYLRTTFKITTPLLAIGLALVWVFRRPVITLLFSDELSPAADFIHYQLAADLFALPSFLLVFVIVAGKKTNTYLLIHMLSAMVYLALIMFVTGLTDMGIAGLPLANMLRFVFFLGILVFYTRKELF